MKTAIVYVLASLGEIAGFISFWVWLRLGKSPLWLPPSMTSLALFAYLLTRIDGSTARRAYAAYWSVYIVSSICWLWAVEGRAAGSLGLHRRCGCARRARSFLVSAPRSTWFYTTVLAPGRRRASGECGVSSVISRLTLTVPRRRR
jgi:small multidrug resistance family-3 protein